MGLPVHCSTRAMPESASLQILNGTCICVFFLSFSYKTNHFVMCQFLLYVLKASFILSFGKTFLPFGNGEIPTENFLLVSL
jgi:hypothetical protein